MLSFILEHCFSETIHGEGNSLGRERINEKIGDEEKIKELKLV